MGFTLDQVRDLLRLSAQENQPCTEVNRISAEHLTAIEQKIADLTRLADELRRINGRYQSGGLSRIAGLSKLYPRRDNQGQPSLGQIDHRPAPSDRRLNRPSLLSRPQRTESFAPFSALDNSQKCDAYFASWYRILDYRSHSLGAKLTSLKKKQSGLASHYQKLSGKLSTDKSRRSAPRRGA